VQKNTIVKFIRIAFISIILLSAIAFVMDFRRFARSCAEYGESAQKGLGLLTSFPVSPTEAIVVLTGDRYRIPRALEALRLRGSPLLIISGAGRGISLTELVNQQRDATINIHEIWKKIILESNSQSTIENAEESAKIVVKNKIDRIILATSEYHMLRSVTIFRRVMPDVEIIEYPVASDLTIPNHAFSQRTLNGLWNFWVEYWKLFLYKFYFSRDVHPVHTETN
jgi:uncharacterized SAM-binding protein YcdF (DUF218 family)